MTTPSERYVVPDPAKPTLLLGDQSIRCRSCNGIVVKQRISKTEWWLIHLLSHSPYCDAPDLETVVANRYRCAR